MLNALRKIKLICKFYILTSTTHFDANINKIDDFVNPRYIQH